MQYYCDICGAWVEAKTLGEAVQKHLHLGVVGYFEKAKPTGLYNGVGDQVGVRSVYGGKKWRAYLLETVEGYTDHPVFGHEAGHCIHILCHLFKDWDDEPIEARTESELLKKLNALSGLTNRGEHRLFGGDDWRKRYPLVDSDRVRF